MPRFVALMFALGMAALAAGAEASTRQERVQQREERAAAREAGLYGPHLCVGLSLDMGFYDFADEAFSYSGDQNNMPVGVFAALRSQFRHHLGAQLGVGTAMGLDGAGFLTVEAKPLIGPFGRLVLEPTVGFTHGSRRHHDVVNNVPLPEHTERLTTTDAGIAASLYLGQRDQWPVTAGFKIGMGPENDLFAVYAKGAYAFALGSR